MVYSIARTGIAGVNQGDRSTLLLNGYGTDLISDLWGWRGSTFSQISYLALPATQPSRSLTPRHKADLSPSAYFHYIGRMKENNAVLALAALAQSMRLRIFRRLVGAGPQGLTPGALSAVLKVPASTLSFHLKELMRAGMVTQERAGRSLIYRPALAKMNSLLEYMTAHCCEGEPCAAVNVRSAGRRPMVMP